MHVSHATRRCSSDLVAPAHLCKFLVTREAIIRGDPNPDHYKAISPSCALFNARSGLDELLEQSAEARDR